MPDASALPVSPGGMGRSVAQSLKRTRRCSSNSAQGDGTIAAPGGRSNPDERTAPGLLTEHQTTVDRWTPCRFFRSTDPVWSKALAENPGIDRLPLVVPIVLTHAKERWRASTQLHDLVGALPSCLQDKVPRLSYFVFDLREMSDAQIVSLATTASLRLFLLILPRQLRPYRFREQGHAGHSARVASRLFRRERGNRRRLYVSYPACRTNGTANAACTSTSLGTNTAPQPAARKSAAAVVTMARGDEKVTTRPHFAH